jgi:lipopolysaccharide/colanic/teichoic acid biosynthesis glycosyltransferase
MARNELRISGEQAGQTLGIRIVRSAFFFTAAALLFGAAWAALVYLPLRWSGPILFLTALLLALALAGGLANIEITEQWRGRLSFLAAASLPLFCWGLGAFSHSFWPAVQALPGPGVGFIALFWAGTGAFVGVLSAAALQYGLWEDNSPPSERVQQEVLARHKQWIGAPPATPPAKRAFDLLAAGAGLLLSAPLWALCIFAIWFEDPGPVLFVKNSVGKGGVNFRQFKLRSMVRGAEEHTGPVLAQRNDPRILAVGRFLRKTALDELPQLVNILRGEMSFVGPRPQRTVLVYDYLQLLPEYAGRHRVLPGLAGLAQVAGDYYLTPRQKLRFDRLYIEYCGLGFDLKLLWLAFLLTFYFRWRKNWDGRLPRRLLKWKPGLRPSQD